MKKYVTLVLLGSIMQFAPGYSDEAANEDGKMYVKPRAVRVMKDKIVVFTEDGAFVTPAVQSDENGLFVQQADLVAAPDVKRGNCKGCKRGWGRKMGQGQGWKNGRKWAEKQGQKKGWKMNKGPRWKRDNAQSDDELSLPPASEPVADSE